MNPIKIEGNLKSTPNTVDGNVRSNPNSLSGNVRGAMGNIYSGFSPEIKEALLNCFSHIAWIDENGQEYYDALENAMTSSAELVSISAVYTQSGTVYTTDTLDSLKSDLVVTAHYSDNTTSVVVSYTLSGTLAVGTSTITVTYFEMATTFDVTVTSDDAPSQYTWLYRASSGQLLSAQNYVTMTNTGTYSETLSNGELVCHIDNNGTVGGSSNMLLTYSLTDTTTTNATLSAKAKLIDGVVYGTGTTPIGQRLQLSNGSTGAAFYFLENSGKIYVQYYEGTTVKNVSTDLNTNEYHVFEAQLKNGHQILKIDGTQYVDSSTLSSSYTTNNMIRLQATSTTRTPNGITTNFKWIAYYEES